MLSILIPTYNYQVSELITALHKALEAITFNYEILCLEDGSQIYVEENKATCDSYDHVIHMVSEQNKGRIASRKHLAQNAKYNWLLFLDADVAIENPNFIKVYSDYFNEQFEVVYGGCSYAKEQPNASQLLRWTYGRAKEDVKAHTRNKTPYKSIVSANFLIKKDSFQHIISKIKDEGYGYDVFVGALMKKDETKVYHIDNAVVHVGLDENSVYLSKVENAVETNYKLVQEHKINSTDNSLLETFKRIKRLGLVRMVYGIFNLFRGSMRKQLLGNRPNITLLQFYKLGYLCALSLNKT